MEWIEVVIPVDVDLIDDVAAILVDSCAETKYGVQLRGDEIVFWAPTQEAEHIVAGVRAALTDIAALGMDVDPAAVRLERSGPEEEWRDAWKKHFHVTRIGQRMVIQPSWEPFDPTANDIVIKLDPGMAFGTGTHASTRLVMQEIERLAAQGVAPARVLDVGAGSGILSIAAVKLWPGATALAIDNDPIAVDACRDNVASNGAAPLIVSSIDALPAIGEQFPLVLANIQAHVLLALKDDLVAKVAPGGWLIMSGLLSTQAAGVAEQFVAAGFAIDASRPDAEDPQWTTVVLRRAA